MCDDFHGTEEWAVFMASLSRVFPDRQVVDIPNGPHFSHRLRSGRPLPGARRTVRALPPHLRIRWLEPHWRGIYDDHGRLIVAICNDMDLGDSWEHADNPEYPQKFSALGIRIGVDYVVYAMTH